MTTTTGIKVLADASDRDRIAARNRAWYRANRDQVRANQRVNAAREELRTRHGACYQENWEQVRNRQHEYREANKDAINTRRRAKQRDGGKK